ncbi:unnamed protein product [Dracunculus medinensis]|uniref:SCP domain-containing protein n=1 Tax=Dracunculus medinensis TaxID=318479 RepID=A0A0N4US63_DRAME|nr:unnamed protein product [Dracunculus medinensis]
MKSSSGQNLPLQLKYDLENATFSSEQEPSTNTSTQNNTVEMSTLDVNSSASQFESFDSDSSESESVEIETVSTYQPTTMETVSTHETTRLADTMQASLGCSKSNITVKVQERVLARHKIYRSTLEYVIAKMHGYLPDERRELKWNCSLEESAQLWANDCSWAHSSAALENKIGESLTYSWVNAKSVSDSLLIDFPQSVWDDFVHMERTNITELSTQQFKENFDAFIQMTNLAATDIGCGMALCRVRGLRKAIQLNVCHYYPSNHIIIDKIEDFVTKNEVRFLELARAFS